MKDIGAVAAGEVPTADEAQDGLDMLNDMLAQWSNKKKRKNKCKKPPNLANKPAQTNFKTWANNGFPRN